jgi:hypothetical protein
MNTSSSTNLIGLFEIDNNGQSRQPVRSGSLEKNLSIGSTHNSLVTEIQVRNERI